MRGLEVDLVLTPSFSVWVADTRFVQLVNIRRAALFYHLLAEAGVPAVPDVSFYYFDPDGRLWAEWVNDHPDVQAVSLFCGGMKINASKKALRESVEDVAVFHRVVRPDVTFVIGGVHSLARLLAYRRVAPGRRLVFCNGMAYALAQRRKLLGGRARAPVATSARDCFLHNRAYNDRTYRQILQEPPLPPPPGGRSGGSSSTAMTRRRIKPVSRS